MSEIYITGHKNPDTDSIVAAIAYANLKNSLGDREYTPVRIGAINDETSRMLARFGFEPPALIRNMRTQVCDLDFDRPPVLNCTVTMDLAWRTMRDCETSTLPIVHEDGSLFGLLSAGDIAEFDMENISNGYIDELPVFNLLSVLEGSLVNEISFVGNTISGEVRLALPQFFSDSDTYPSDTILICGDQPDVIRSAIDSKVHCIVICQGNILSDWADAPSDTCIISTPLDARSVSRLIFEAKPISSVVVARDPICFHLSDYVDDVREVMLKNRFHYYPVLDENDRVVGTLARFHLLRPRRKRVILVDHNEASQSVSGLEQVEVMEIIDHHRLADIQTLQPIYVRNEPVGSTNTIITQMYQESGVTPSAKMAGLMAAAILSDTVLFKSPTCTKRDIAMAERLARIAHISLDELGKELYYSSGTSGKTAEELFKTDFKQFHIAEMNIGIGQITCADSDHFRSRKEEFLEVMARIKKEHEYDLILLMITDVLLEGSLLFYVGSDDIISQAFTVTPHENEFFLPKVMSRKKQIVPMLTALWG